ncbi:MAG: Asp23/Gls24 family envelope stress response protein [bacterium]
MTAKEKEPAVPTRGEVRVSNDIVEQIVCLAANEIEGVSDLRSRNGLRGLLNLFTSGRHVKVEVGTKEVAVDLEIGVEYGSRIPDVVKDIRQNITRRINDMTGLELVELNIRVNDLSFPDEKLTPDPRHEIPRARVK